MNSKIKSFLFVLCFLTFLTCSPVALTEDSLEEEQQIEEILKEETPQEEPFEEEILEEEILQEELHEEEILEDEILENNPSPEEESEPDLEDIPDGTDKSDAKNLTEEENPDNTVLADDQKEETQDENSEDDLVEQATALLLLSDSLEEELLANPAEPSYVLTIPQSMEVPFNTISAQLGTVGIESSSGFQEGQGLSVTITYDSFSSGTTSSQIPYLLSVDLTDSASGTVPLGGIVSGQQLTFKGTQDGTLAASDSNGSTSNGENPYTNFVIKFEAEADSWVMADPGEYSSAIVFVSSITE